MAGTVAAIAMVPVFCNVGVGECVSEINTGGGPAVQGNVNPVGDFIGGNRISYENNQYLQFIRDQVIEMKAKMLIMEQEIDGLRADGRRGASASWLQFGNIIAAVIVALALFYFGSGLFEVARELRTGNTIQQRIQEQRNYIPPERGP